MPPFQARRVWTLVASVPTSAASALVGFAFAGGAFALAGDGSNAAETPGQQAPVRAQDERANTFTSSTQDSVALDVDANGGIVLTWQSRRQDEMTYGVYAQRFDPAGKRLGGEVKVNVHVDGPQTQPAVALDSSGAAWFAWESFAQDGDLGGIYARRFDAQFAGGEEVRVNSSVAGHQAECALAGDGEGSALVAWTGPSAAGRAVFVRALSARGECAGPEVRVDEAPEGSGERAVLPSVAWDPRGGWVVAWSRADERGAPNALLARRLDRLGAPSGEVRQVVGLEHGAPVEPAVAIDARGAVAIAWLGAAAEDYVPHLRRFTADESEGTWLASDVVSLPTQCPGYTSGLDLAFDDAGRIALAWSSFGDARNEADSFVRWIEVDGRVGPPERATRASDGSQRLAVGAGGRRVAVTRGGGVALAWSGDAGLGDDTGAHLSLLAPRDSNASAEELGRGELAAKESTSDSNSKLTAQTSNTLEDGATAKLEAGGEHTANDSGVADESAAPHDPPVRVAPSVVSPNNLLSQGGPDFGFEGIAQTTLTPPDPHLAVGPNHVVQVVNASVAWYTKTGVQQGVLTQDAFFQTSGFMFDAEAIWDPHSQRFMVMTNNRVNSQSRFELAVSDDADPNGAWHRYSFNVTALANSSSIDSPNIGVDGQAVYLSADFPPFTSGNFLIFIVDKAPLLTGAPNPTTRSLFLTTSQSWGTPVMLSSAPAFYLVQGRETPTATEIVLHAITDPLGAPTLTSLPLAVPAYQAPEDPPQLGTSTRPEAFEARFWSAVFRGGRLYATHHQGAARVLQRWYEIDMANWPLSGTPSLVQSGDVDLGPGVRTSFGSIAVDGQGAIALTYTRSSPTEFLSMARSYRLPSDPPGVLTPSVTMRSSNAPTFVNRWGDYSGAVADPNADGVFWGTGEYFSGAWGTWIGVWGPCEAPTAYCTGKLSSFGTTPSVGSLNDPSLGANHFRVSVDSGPPNRLGLVYSSSAPAATPFFNGFLCAQQPVQRSPIMALDGLGHAELAVPIDVSMLGTKRYYGWWMRDPGQADGTGVALSNGLAVTFCP
jgi:hypothetical protein